MMPALHLATFRCDVTPPVGHPLCGGWIEPARAAQEALKRTTPFSHVGVGQARISEVASNRRILGPDGRIRATRTSATRDPKVRAEPEGLIDPMLKTLSFWNGNQPLAALHYY